MNPLSASWKEIAQLLHEARACLSPDLVDRPSSVPDGVLSGTLDEFDEFLEHNELELAWDALVAVADRVGAPTPCWRKLAEAAQIMQLPIKQQQALAKAQK